MSEILICPSMMCARFGNLHDEVKELDEAGADVFHMDIMDGQFVPNFSMGIQDYEYIRSVTDKKMDAHLMIMNPGNYIDLFADLGANIIYIHPEADLHPTRTLAKIKDRGILAGIAINPGTSVESVKELLYLADVVMVMSVNPGFAGQKYLPFVDNKIQELVDLKADYQFKLSIDGAISEERIKTLSKVGVDAFILGTSALFGKDASYKELIQKYKSFK
ncbi:ribulose-phosphate 3-epimerase [Aerococcus urinae]|uniref:ribulose-phosphate 3-epimerase n=1 Tax=Aerococcus TaxID=1375 RepID=UPI0018A75FA7|nr:MULTISPECIES: ribulose-phosphate 3-epimerase [Aerococcus]MCY3036189.1 ribulose-phosphate 3-epimerase [Aerococcus sp. Group 2]MDK6520203.1 ribulose-phosphate 3-epimerase [Aerococcus urinae]